MQWLQSPGLSSILSVFNISDQCYICSECEYLNIKKINVRIHCFRSRSQKCLISYCGCTIYVIFERQFCTMYLLVNHLLLQLMGKCSLTLDL